MSSRRQACPRRCRRQPISFQRFIITFARLPLHERDSGWAWPLARVKKPRSTRLLVTLEIHSFPVSVGTLKKTDKSDKEMADDVRPEDEVREKQLDEFYSYVAGPTQGNPFREHWSRTRHLPSCCHREFGAGTSFSCCVGSMSFATAANFVNDMLN